MKKTIKIAFMLAFVFTCFSAFELKAQGNPNPQSVASMGTTGSGKVLALDPGAKSGLMLEEATGIIIEFHYAGLEVLEVNTEYVYIVQLTVSGKIIIRDIHRR
jgi:hypothetical protein